MANIEGLDRTKTLVNNYYNEDNHGCTLSMKYALVLIEFSTFSTALTFPERHTVGTHHNAGFSVTWQCAYKFPHVSPSLDRSFIFIMNNVLLFGNTI